MRTVLFAIALSFTAAPAVAQTPRVQLAATTGDVCIIVDESRDTLPERVRASAVLVLGAQFELAGRRVVLSGCDVEYTVRHVRLGESIFVTLSGAGETREGTALGLDDLPALYSQMVRSILTGRPMTGFNVIDRTNVTAAQAHANRVHSERYGYARLGYGAILGDRAYSKPSVGFGYRVEGDSFGFDVSFFNMLAGGDASGSSAMAGSLIKLQVLYFLRPEANASPYFGGGLSWGGTSFHGGPEDYSAGSYSSDYNGSGLHGEVTVGYELPRASTFRVFVEATAVLPFYRVESQTYSYVPGRSDSGATIDSRYAPSVLVSLGMGWDRSGRR